MPENAKRAIPALGNELGLFPLSFEVIVWGHVGSLGIFYITVIENLQNTKADRLRFSHGFCLLRGNTDVSKDFFFQ